MHDKLCLNTLSCSGDRTPERLPEMDLEITIKAD